MHVIRFPFVVAFAFCSLMILVSPVTAIADGEVSGTITIDGKPLADGKITFHRDNGQFVGSKVKDGRYKVDRVPTGSLRVTLEGESVPHEYASEDTSGLVVKAVEEGPTRFDFYLTAS